MDDIGFNDNLTTGAREFHIQTATLVDEGIIRTEVFEKGRVLFVENFPYERREGKDSGAEGRLRRLVDGFHQTMIEEIDTLFEMSERIFEEENVSAHERIGQVFLYMHIFDRAEKHFQKTLELAPERHSCYIYLARCHYFQKRYKQSVDTLKALREKGVHYPDMYNLMGLIMLEKGKFRHALQYFKEALKQNQSYIEAYVNMAETILARMLKLDPEQQAQDFAKSVEFLQIIIKKIDNYGGAEDRQHCTVVLKTIKQHGPQKALSLMHEYREKRFMQRIPPEIIGFRFQLRLLYTEEEMSSELLESYEEKIASALEESPSYPDLWHYLALIHLMQCRHYFLKGLDNFKDATRINPSFDKANKNLRLVENDGREFLSLIKTIV
ncbi:MAG: hypothetical protein KDI06_17795 [Calditrichaeota bacterium]|nr:hypothetical protein [Calditrichota bacterium]